VKPAVICFSGGIGSGKTEVSRRVAAQLGWTRASFGDYVRGVALARGLAGDRAELQAIGEELVAGGIISFCRSVLADARWSAGLPLVVDGIRHLEALEAVRQLVAPLVVALVHLGTPDEVRIARLMKSRPEDAEQIGDLDKHSTEIQVKQSLPSVADLVLDGSLGVDELTAAVVALRFG
jgi:dephospho-CoA kinase